MKLIIDTEARKLIQESGDARREIPLYSDEAFSLISAEWLKVGWNQKYTYTFSWMGRPVIQLPEDMIRVQEVIYRTKPDVIVETGVAHGGSLVFYASLCKAMEKGRVIGVDIEIRPHNRRAIEAHEFFPWITLVEGNAVAPEIVGQVRQQIRPGESVLVLLDSCHTRDRRDHERPGRRAAGQARVVRRSSHRGRRPVCRGASGVRTGTTTLAVQRKHPAREHHALAGRLVETEIDGGFA
jgi:hypothetical protein